MSVSPQYAVADRRGERPTAVIIEIAGKPAGIAAVDGARFRFHAAAPRFQGLDGQIFRTPGDAERAARRVNDRRRRGHGLAAVAGEARR